MLLQVAVVGCGQDRVQGGLAVMEHLAEMGSEVGVTVVRRPPDANLEVAGKAKVGKVVRNHGSELKVVRWNQEDAGAVQPVRDRETLLGFNVCISAIERVVEDDGHGEPVDGGDMARAVSLQNEDVWLGGSDAIVVQLGKVDGADGRVLGVVAGDIAVLFGHRDCVLGQYKRFHMDNGRRLTWRCGLSAVEC